MGSGSGLFAETAPSFKLELAACEACTTSAVLLSYKNTPG
jgi:hypothetical protein